ncbi:MAG: hypothetical protein LBD94_00600 [Rickettsiales bacterium]|jgi:hypothetical protein|nr:hypothetical protein [Rickettsiales bacterium]
MADILLGNAAPPALKFINMFPASTGKINRFFERIETGSDEQFAYFPFNPENPIYKKNGIRPEIKIITNSNNCEVSVLGVLLGSDNGIYLEVGISMFWEKDRFEIYISHVSNENSAPENRYKNVAAHYINTLQNFLIYSKNPNRLSLRAADQGKHYWAKWFDFNYVDAGLEEYLSKYRKKFSKAMNLTFGCSAKLAKRVVKDLSKPIQFRNVNRMIGGNDDRIGIAAMEQSLSWDGKCGLEEMISDNPIRREGMDILKSRGIKFEHPIDFQKLIRKKLKTR